MIDEKNIEALAARFDAMAKAREDEAEKDHHRVTIARLDASATAYRRCAEEVRRVAVGEMPASPGECWE